MKFITTITALAALLPITTLAAVPPAEADEVIVLDNSAPAETFDAPPANATDAVAGVDFDPAPLSERDLEERGPQSSLTITVYRNRGCSGPSYPIKAKYDSGYAFRIQSYKTSRRLKWGEVISLYGAKNGNTCVRETSHTPMAMAPGCHGLGGGSVNGASCVKLWRRQGFIY
ncbi:MAG: hypothetical protein Q9169_002821 [Polycauliona sp. 2 TL-2023]